MDNFGPYLMIGDFVICCGWEYIWPPGSAFRWDTCPGISGSKEERHILFPAGELDPVIHRPDHRIERDHQAFQKINQDDFRPELHPCLLNQC
jgi:hypothetical protein